MKIYRLFTLLAAISCCVFVARAQNQPPQSPEEREKQLLEFIDKEVERLRNLLDLEYWQEFYVDSTLTHDYKAMTQEMEDMQKAKVENRDLYVNVQDKWMQQIDNSYQRFFTEEQWKKYMKSGGKRAKDARDKRNKKK